MVKLIDSKVLVEVDPALIRSVPNEKVERAIASLLIRLSGWQTTVAIEIYPDGKNDLIGIAKREDGTNNIVIGAVWRETEQEYSYHS